MATFERTTLSNGVRVLTAPMPQAQSVSCFIMFAAGARYETAEIGGIAHFAEHMFFKGTERRPTARDIATEIDGIGGEFNAFTGKEYTGYYVKCAAGTRDIALDVLVDMLRNSRFDPEEIEREKGVIVEEMNMYFDTPRDFVGGVYENLLYGDQPARPRHHRHQGDVSAPPPGRPSPRSSITGTGRSGWSSGSADASGTGSSERLEELLGSIEPRETGVPDPVVIPANGSPVQVHTKQSDQAHIVLGARSYPLGHPDRYALQLLATVLGGGMSSRLFTEVRERRGLAYYVFGTNSSYTDAGSLYAQAGVDIQRIDDAVHDGRRRAAAHREGARPGERAREGPRLRQGTLRAGPREPARDDHVRAASRGAAGGRRGARGSARRARRRHRRGHPAGRAGRRRGRS